MTIAELRADIKNKNLKNLYLFYGAEEYLINKYVRQMADLADFPELNYYFFDGNIDESAAREAIEQYPQMSERKIVVLRESGLLKTKNMDFLTDLPDYASVVFVEKEISKLNKAMVSAIPASVRFERQNKADLRAWAAKKLAEDNKKIRQSDLEFLIDICESSLGRLELELDKLAAAAGERDEITRALIERLVAVPLEYKVFDLVNLLVNKEKKRVYIMLDELKRGKEEPIALLGIVFSQVSAIVMVKNLRDDGINNIEEYFPPNRRFLAGKYSRGRYDYALMRRVMELCADMDVRIKTGRIDGWVAVEIIAAEMLG